MKTLINNLYAIFGAAVTAGTIIKPANIEGIDILKGIKEDPTTELVLQHFYIALDDGGERVEDIISNKSQKRYYSIVLEMGVYAPDRELSLDYILDLTNQVKNVLELSTSRQKDGHIFGVSIVPMTITYDNGFFRGRQIIIDYYEVEDRIFEY
jgi:hypothetical protein